MILHTLGLVVLATNVLTILAAPIVNTNGSYLGIRESVGAAASRQLEGSPQISNVTISTLNPRDPSEPPKESMKLIESIEMWLKDAETQKKIKEAHHTKGGWEGWAQVEIAYFFQTRKTPWHEAHPGASHTIRREERIYTEKPNDRVDFLLGVDYATKNAQGQDLSGTNAIELKCETSSKPGNAFKKLVEGDVKKTDEGCLEIPEGGSCEVWNIAISYTDVDLGSIGLKKYPPGEAKGITLWYKWERRQSQSSHKSSAPDTGHLVKNDKQDNRENKVQDNSQSGLKRKYSKTQLG